MERDPRAIQLMEFLDMDFKMMSEQMWENINKD